MSFVFNNKHVQLLQNNLLIADTNHFLLYSELASNSTYIDSPNVAGEPSHHIIHCPPAELFHITRFGLLNKVGDVLEELLFVIPNYYFLQHAVADDPLA